MKNKMLQYVSLLAVFILMGCSSGKFYTNSQYGINKLKGLKTFKINDLKIPFKADAESELITLNMKQALIKELKLSGFQEVNENPDFTINGELNFFDKGNAALRYLVGYGAGKAKAKFMFEILAKSVDKPIEGVGQGELNMGSFGGDVKIMTTKIAKNITKQINQ